MSFESYAELAAKSMGLGIFGSDEMHRKFVRGVAAAVERAVLDERQVFLFLVEKFADRKHEESGTQWCLEELIKAVELRGAATDNVVRAFGVFLSRQKWPGADEPGKKASELGAFNSIAGTRYLSWEAAARSILTGQAPGKLDDNEVIWAAVGRLRDHVMKKPEKPEEGKGG